MSKQSVGDVYALYASALSNPALYMVSECFPIPIIPLKVVCGISSRGQFHKLLQQWRPITAGHLSLVSFVVRRVEGCLNFNLSLNILFTKLRTQDTDWQISLGGAVL